MLAARNRRFGVAAWLAAFAAVATTAAEALYTTELYRGPSYGGEGFARGLEGVAAIVALVGWVAIGLAFTERIDWGRLRAGIRIVLIGSWIAFVAVALNLYVNLANPLFGQLRISLGFSALSFLLVALATTVARRAVGDEGGPLRATRLRRAALLYAGSFLALTGAAIFEQAYYAHYAVPGALTSGLTLGAIGGAVVAVAAIIGAQAFAETLSRREATLALAGALAAAALTCVVVGDALRASGFARIHYPGLIVAGSWVGLVANLGSAAAVACAALAARNAIPSD